MNPSPFASGFVNTKQRSWAPDVDCSGTRRRTTPCGASPDPVGGVYDPRTGKGRARVVVSARLTMYLSIADACSSVSVGCAGIATLPHTPDPPSRIFFMRRAVAVLSCWYFRATSTYAGPIDFRFG